MDTLWTNLILKILQSSSTLLYNTTVVNSETWLQANTTFAPWACLFQTRNKTKAQPHYSPGRSPRYDQPRVIATVDDAF